MLITEQMLAIIEKKITLKCSYGQKSPGRVYTVKECFPVRKCRVQNHGSWCRVSSRKVIALAIALTPGTLRFQVRDSPSFMHVHSYFHIFMNCLLIEQKRSWKESGSGVLSCNEWSGPTRWWACEKCNHNVYDIIESHRKYCIDPCGTASVSDNWRDGLIHLIASWSALYATKVLYLNFLFLFHSQRLNLHYKGVKTDKNKASIFPALLEDYIRQSTRYKRPGVRFVS